MRVTRSLILSSFCTLLLATAAAAQGAFPPAVQAMPSLSTSPRGAWLERFQESRSGPGEQRATGAGRSRSGQPDRLDLSNISGDIVITGGAGDEIRVEAVKRANGHNDAETKRQLEGVTIEASEHAGRVEISTSYPRKQNSQVDVDYTVHVPAGAAVSVRSVSGDIELTGRQR